MSVSRPFLNVAWLFTPEDRSRGEFYRELIVPLRKEPSGQFGWGKHERLTREECKVKVDYFRPIFRYTFAHDLCEIAVVAHISIALLHLHALPHRRGPVSFAATTSSSQRLPPSSPQSW